MYPAVRLRRNRKAHWLRDLVAETTLVPHNLILPVFVAEGSNIRQEIKTMPDVYCNSIDNIIITAKEAQAEGIKAIALFPNIESRLKTSDAKESSNINNLICRTVKGIKDAGVDIGIICDVALDPYTVHGHDGILGIDNDVDNDTTIDALCSQAITLAKAGADIVAPSDMMDGRISKIRKSLDSEGFAKVNILSYSAKYNSSFYGPFRDAVGGTNDTYLNKATYQMDIRNKKEAMREIRQDISEGADIVMIKPAMLFLDVIHYVSERFDINIFAYQVSGEYAMLKFAALAGAINFKKSMLESLISIKRSGASAIFTYSALEIAQILNS